MDCQKKVLLDEFGNMKSPQQIKEILALPGEPPTHVVDVTLPQGVALRKGTAGTNVFGKGGAEQYEIISKVDDAWYLRPRKLEELKS